jgi:hypothetical protein
VRARLLVGLTVDVTDVVMGARKPGLARDRGLTRCELRG